ncbi:hypothetical protein [Fructilactobacillus fructivorans]|uniref:Uncharacterized protein n=1 Tax=Fructilactobacillus fructivorans TaxID=1614 RepID=A0A0C1Q2Q0_9LACO|nr:hypothetical protein [Fructilactobacillus fructivorans]KID42088.1 hypothetical protein LfDm3_0493 [Fructilactobacillus fructivorans]MCT0151980.1 hypothetical protein [Fructilactobacillus fructivorans]MCT2867872.1 hypothetical protein [Fructilactobacillus fructivorans]MCT2868546.1 hypothetical protein [Fructilactobacillus fructivorans]MCT2873546.1 hypothetical protein [Fructilactobacillus fructivorans]
MKKTTVTLVAAGVLTGITITGLLMLKKKGDSNPKDNVTLDDWKNIFNSASTVQKNLNRFNHALENAQPVMKSLDRDVEQAKFQLKPRVNHLSDQLNNF